ncbi:MAG: hypothetical protein FWF91_02400 [Coriobacteriia bacterium]|nr:hypothetical protein [Coriobacteriia bacterium]
MSDYEIHTFEDINTASDFELKHTPSIEVIEDTVYIVSIGLKGIAHPQTEEHLIEWIKIFDGPELIDSVEFTAADAPEAAFDIEQVNEQIIVQAYCNLHGVWEARF